MQGETLKKHLIWKNLVELLEVYTFPQVKSAMDKKFKLYKYSKVNKLL